MREPIEDDWEPEPPTDEEMSLWLKEARSQPRVSHRYTIWQRRVEVLIYHLRAERQAGRDSEQG